MAKILIVDDRPTNRQFLLTLLGYGNHYLFEAADGAQALELAQMEHPDLVISDILMPTMDGYEFVQQLRADPSLVDTPVIFHTATYSTPQAQALAKSCGVSIVLPKPCEPQEMLAAVNEIIGGGNPVVANAATVADKIKAPRQYRDGEQFGEYLHDLESVKLGFDEILQHDLQLFANPDLLREMAGRFSENVIGMQRIASRLSALTEVGMEMISERDPARLVKLFFGAACDIVDAEYAAIGMLDEREQDLKYVFAKQIDTRIYHSGYCGGWLATLLAGHLQISVHQVSVAQSAEGLPAGHPPVNSFLGVQVACAGQVYGWLYFADKHDGEFSAEDVHLATILASRLALMFENASFYDVIQRHAAQLQVEVGERKKVEDEIRLLNQNLEQRVTARTTELEAANKELEAFSYSVSHDLRAPLRSINGFSAILQEDYAAILPRDAICHLDRIRDNTRQMGQLIDDLLCLAKTARQPLVLVTVALESLVRECFDEFSDEIKKRQVTLDIGNLPECQADATLLKQALRNLIGNAVKYTRRQPHPLIEVGCRSAKDKQIVYVKDNGAGFDMSYAGKLFGVFQRLHRDKDFEGTGVGLATVQRIVTRHGGQVWAEGKVDQGATFYFTLPSLYSSGT